jgi:hypothetical protein
VVERCPDKTEVHGSIPCTRTMPAMEGAPKLPQESVEQQPPVLPPETMKKVNAFNQAMRVWDAFEKGKLAATPAERDMDEAVIDALEFLKRHNLRNYTAEQESAQFEKVDAYIEQLRGEEKEEVPVRKLKPKQKESADIQPAQKRKTA